MKKVFCLSFMITLLISCSEPSPPEDISDPTKSAVDLIVGTYDGTAKRWYWHWNQGPECQNSTAFTNYEKQGAAQVTLTKASDSTVNISIVSLNNQFDAFTVAGSTGLIKVKKVGTSIVGSRNIQYNLNGGGGVLRGAEYFTFTGKTVSVRIDHSTRSTYSSTCGSGTWSTFDIVEATATR